MPLDMYRIDVLVTTGHFEVPSGSNRYNTTVL